MRTIWVFRFDGTIQCDSDSDEISLEEMRKDLESRIGERNILNMEKRSLTMFQLCGMPTGAVNAYEITQEGWVLLDKGIAGNPGYVPWPERNVLTLTEEVSASQVLGLSVKTLPTSIKELIGRPLRVYKTGEGTTFDYRPERVNVEVDESRKIADIWFG